MNTILIGVDGSPRSEDAIAFGGRVAAASGAQVIVACAFPDNREHGYGALRDAALDTACAMSRKLEGVQARQISIRAFAAPPAQALRELAITTGASLVVVASSRRACAGGAARARIEIWRAWTPSSLRLIAQAVSSAASRSAA